MPGRRPPSVRSRQLAAELRRLREAAVLTGDEAAARLGWSPSKISRIENGHSAVKTADLRALLDLYEVAGPPRDRLLELSRSANQRGWWDAYGDTLQEEYSALLALEDAAQSERAYTHSFIPSLLQTEAYARQAMNVLDYPPGETARRITVRMTQQRVLTRTGPLEFRVVLDEACIRRWVGPDAVMAGQLRHLAEVVQLPNVTLRVMPFAAGYHEAMTGAFKILHFPEAGATDVVFLENRTSALFVEDEPEVHIYARTFAKLEERSLDPEESITLIRRVAEESR